MVTVNIRHLVIPNTIQPYRLNDKDALALGLSEGDEFTLEHFFRLAAMKFTEMGTALHRNLNIR